MGERGLVVCANGASVYDPARHELVERTDLAPAVVRELIDEIAEVHPDALFGLEQGFEFSVDSVIRDRPDDFKAMTSWQLPGIRIGPIRDFLDEDVTKLIVRLPPDVPAGTVTLVWRGTLEVADRRHERLDHLLVVEEPVDAPLALDDYAAVLREKLVDKRAEAAKKRAEAYEKKRAEIMRRGIADAAATLKEGGAPAELVDEVAKQETLDDAQRVIAAWVERVQAALASKG